MNTSCEWSLFQLHQEVQLSLMLDKNWMRCMMMMIWWVNDAKQVISTTTRLNRFYSSDSTTLVDWFQSTRQREIYKSSFCRFNDTVGSSRDILSDVHDVQVRLHQEVQLSTTFNCRFVERVVLSLLHHQVGARPAGCIHPQRYTGYSYELYVRRYTLCVGIHTIYLSDVTDQLKALHIQ